MQHRCLWWNDDDDDGSKNEHTQISKHGTFRSVVTLLPLGLGDSNAMH